MRRGPVPGGTTTVILNVTALGVGTGYVTVYPCGDRPNASNLNYVTGQTIHVNGGAYLGG